MKNQSGMTLIELMLAVLILMVGVVAVAQLVPSAMRSNLANRYDSTAAVVAERMMELLASQQLNNFGPLTADPFQSTQSVIARGPTSCQNLPALGYTTFDCQSILLGNSFPVALLAPNCGPSPQNWAGSPLVPATNAIDWTRPPVRGYSAAVIDPTDPQQSMYEVRWAVDTRWGLIPCTATGFNTPLMKRYVVSVRKLVPVSQSQFIVPTSITMIRTNGLM